MKKFLFTSMIFTLLLIMCMPIIVFGADDPGYIVSEVQFENFTWLVNGQTYTQSKPTAKLKSGFPGTITKQQIKINGKVMEADTTAGDNIELAVYIKLNDGYTWNSSVNAWLDGKVADDFLKISSMGENERVFIWKHTTEYTDKIKITEQSPETLEYTNGEDVKLYVKATGASNYQWSMYEERGVGIKTVRGFYKIDGATSNEYIIKNADSSLDGKEYRCTLAVDDATVFTKTITLKLVEKKTEQPTQTDEVKTVSVSGIVEPFRNRAPEYTVDASEQYTVENFYWYDLTDGYTIDGGYEFEDGHEYRVILDLKAKPGYRFDITNMKVSVNGVTGTCESLSGKPTTEWVRVLASFICSGSSVSGTVGDCQYTFYYNTKLLRIYGGTKIYSDNFNIDTEKLEDGEVIQYPWDTYYDQIESVVIGEGITHIGIDKYGRAFEQCTNLRSVKLPNSLEEIGNMTFARCTSLQNISLPPNLYFIGEDAFYRCTSLGNFTLPSGLLYIGMQAFFECTGLTHMTFPSSVRTIGANAFMNCVNLTEVTFPENSIAAIESTAFLSTGLSSVYLPSGVTFRGYFSRPSEMQFGYIFIKVGHHTKRSDFKIITDSKDSAAYTYAKENGFDVTVLIKNVDISGLAEPVINQTASTALVLSPENVYGADVQWRNETDGTYLSAGDKFRSGKVYAVYCTLYANDDYGFATNNGSSAVTASLNGKRPAVQTFNEIDPEDTIRLKLTFPKLDPNITSAQITGVGEPSFKWGFYTSDFSLNNPGLEGYVQWYDVTGGGSTWIREDNQFVRYNRTYEARVYLSAKEDYVINADNFTATINGQNARIFTDNGKVVAAITFDTPPVPEEMRIDEIRFTNIDRPVVGAHPDYDFDADGNYTITGFKWINPDLNENSVFEKNTIYRLQIEFEANEGYLFNTDVVYVDTAESSEGTSNIDLKNPDKYRKTVITFPATESYEVLRSLDLTDISAPVLGGDVNFNFTRSEGFNVDNSKAFWYCNEDGRFLNAGEKFEAKQYSAIFEISAKDGYRFDLEFALEGIFPTVNGSEAQAERISGRSEARFLRIRYDFPTLGETPVVNKKIKHVDITGVTLPLAGDVPVNAAFCSDEGVTIEDVSWWDNAMGYWMEPGLTFEAGKEYRLKIEISADDYYEFYQNELTGVELVGTVNGKKAELGVVSGHDFGEKLVLNAYYVCQPKTTEEKTWIKASDWAEEELVKANKLDVIPEIFKKQDLTQNITRKEFAHVAVKLYEELTGNKATAVANNPFKDTDDVEVLKAYNIGITQGTGADTFTPDALITREQMATMMTRALTKAGIDTKVDLEKATKFADDAEMHDWGKESIYYMSSIEIIKGVGNNTFNVLGNATREQALLISVRSAEKFAK